MKNQLDKNHLWKRLFILVLIILFISNALWVYDAKRDASMLRPGSMCNYDAFEKISEYSNTHKYKETAETRQWDRQFRQIQALLIDRKKKDPAIAEILDSSFGGAWLDSLTGKLKVGLVEGTATTEKTRKFLLETLDMIGARDSAEIVLVKYPHAKLREIQAEIAAMPRPKFEPEDQYSGYMSTRSELNKVVVSMPLDKSNIRAGHCYLLSELKSKYKDFIVIHTVTSTDALDLQSHSNTSF